MTDERYKEIPKKGTPPPEGWACMVCVLQNNNLKRNKTYQFCDLETITRHNQEFTSKSFPLSPNVESESGKPIQQSEDKK
ncbi:hypothetical protein KW795_02665 [Candidatus Microgenomates bacterium]|nr:hypothetical protein [Candidatus Microgenomates bacterium]